MVENCSNSNFTSFLGRFRDISIGALMGESRQSEIEYLELGMLILNSLRVCVVPESIKDINENFGDKTLDFNRKAAALAREVCEEHEFRDKQRYVISTGYLPSSNDPDLGQKTPIK